MRATLLKSIIVVTTAFAVSGTSVLAQDGDAKEEAPAESAVTQGDVALVLVQRLGLAASLPTNPSQAEAAAALLAQGIAPFDGWKLDEVLTVGDFARLIVLALGADVDPEKADDPQAYVDKAKEMNLDVQMQQVATTGLKTVGSTTPGVSGQLSSSDPLLNRNIFGEPDERSSGADTASPTPSVQGITLTTPVTAAAVAQVISRSSRSGGSSTVRPVTPN